MGDDWQQLSFDHAFDDAWGQLSSSKGAASKSAAPEVCSSDWSSTENNNNNAWKQRFSDGNQNNNNKNNNNRVRCARSYAWGHSASLDSIEKPLHLISPIADYPVTIEEVFDAYKSCKRRKSSSSELIAFEQKRESNLVELYKELSEQKWEPLPSRVFVVTKPKPREVWAAQFKDRVVHHLVYNRIFEFYTRRFIYDSYACIPGKGVHMAVKRLEKFTRKVSHNYQRPAYYGKFDLANFFPSIDLNILWSILERDGVVKGGVLRYLLWQLLFNQKRDVAIKLSDPVFFSMVEPHKSLFNADIQHGMPIGNLPSQLLANVLNNEIDQYAKRVLGCKYYLRYVDDILILHDDVNFIKSAFSKLERFAQDRVGAAFNPSKTHYNQVSKGIDFLGYYVLPGRTYVRHDSYKRITRKIARAKYEGKKYIESSTAAYKGFFKHSSTRFD